MRYLAALTLVGVAMGALLSGCGSVRDLAGDAIPSLPEEIGEGFDLGELLDQVRDCEALSQTFVNVVQQAADELDAAAEESEGPITEAKFAEKVEAVATSRFFEIAERLGCAKVETELRTIDRLRDLAPESEAGERLVDEVIRRSDQETD